MNSLRPADWQTVEIVCGRRMRRSATSKTLGVFEGCPSGKRPRRAFSTDSWARVVPPCGRNGHPIRSVGSIFQQKHPRVWQRLCIYRRYPQDRRGSHSACSSKPARRDMGCRAIPKTPNHTLTLSQNGEIIPPVVAIIAVIGAIPATTATNWVIGIVITCLILGHGSVQI